MDLRNVILEHLPFHNAIKICRTKKDADSKPRLKSGMDLRLT
jgi:hypothetical protein